MKTIEKVEKKGYKVTYTFGWVGGQQDITGVIATKGNWKIQAKNITGILKQI